MNAHEISITPKPFGLPEASSRLVSVATQFFLDLNKKGLRAKKSPPVTKKQFDTKRKKKGEGGVSANSKF